MNKGIKVKKHPEQREGERFLGNFSRAEYGATVNRETKRLGKKALTSDFQEELGPYEELYPVFVSEKEMRAAGF